MEWSPQQRSIICAPKVSLKIEAGPGSGKTRTITERIIHFIEEEYYVSSQILALTFSVKANLELKRRLFTRLESLCASIEIKTFHSLAFKLLREHTPHYRSLKICDQPKIQARICEGAIAPFRHLPLFPKEFQTPESALWHAGFFKRKHILRLLDPKDVSWEKILTHAIQQHFHDHGYALFDDLCVDALRLLQEDRDIQKQYHQRWAALFVDEFQDLNPLQFEFLKALCGPETILTVVGDTDQAIFGWRGGDANLLSDFTLHFPNVQSKALSQNFRCPQNIVSVANHLIQKNTDRSIKNL
ncbi:MAG: ATP-dependent helicase, partial [Myxococcota bacterium]|nr:ATP-dependent helicase [Myxococcota bacterium]